MSENPVQPLATYPQKHSQPQLVRDFDREKQRELRIRCERLAKEILERKRK